MPRELQASNFQVEFHQRRGHLTDPYVRDLAWLLDSPDLLDIHAPEWRGKIATLFDHRGPAIDAWLIELDRNPDALHALIRTHAFARLGRYAELLMAFFFRHQGMLYAHGLQVRATRNNTIGEFDFLLKREGDPLFPTLLHWEFATKFYLLESLTAHDKGDPEYFVGPNLADTLGAKMRKILDQQLALSHHPAAQILLPYPVALAEALIKGWLFYPLAQTEVPPSLGVSQEHCRGYWCELDALGNLPGDRFLILPKLRWLAPVQSTTDVIMNKLDLKSMLSADFARHCSPILVATMESVDDITVEVDRGFIVPNGWANLAKIFVQKKGKRALLNS